MIICIRGPDEDDGDEEDPVDTGVTKKKNKFMIHSVFFNNTRLPNNSKLYCKQ
jgi:hypothetical protein